MAVKRACDALNGVRVALVFPPYKESRDAISLKENKEHLGLIPPISLAYVASILENEGCLVKLIDISASGLSKEEVVSELREFSPHFLGFTLATFQFQHTLSWIRYIKSFINVPVIVGGIHVPVYPGETMFHHEIDYALTAEAEGALSELIQAVINKKDLSQVKGLCFRSASGDIIINPRRIPPANLDETPFPARHLIPNAKYYSLISQKKNFTAMITSRGCPFRCIFCDNQTIPYRYRSPGNIVDEMQECQGRHNINEIDIFDGVFSINHRRTVEVCREIRRRGLRISWSIRMRVDLITEEVLNELVSSGCMRIYYGIESGSPEILKTINKEVNLARIEEVVKLTKKKGINTFGYFMIGNPGETEATIKQTVSLMKRLPLDYVQIAPVFPPPNTRLYEMVKGMMGEDYWANYTLNGKEDGVLPRYGTTLGDSRIKRHVRSAYLSFYLRPGYILKALLRFRSRAEFFRSVRALKDMIVSYLFNPA